MLALVCLLAGVGCGKRGDPLPPLRRQPEAVAALTIAQVGDRIRLQWEAPRANLDGTRDNVELNEAVILRRVIDIQALVEEQTTTWPPPAKEGKTSSEGEEHQGGLTSQPAPKQKPGLEQTPEVSPPPPSDPDQETVAAEEIRPEAMEAPSTEATPVKKRPAVAPAPAPLAIPPFATGAEEVGRVASLELGEALRFEEPLDPEWMGKRLEYAIRYLNRKKRESPLSPVAQIAPVVPLPAPIELSAEAADGFVRLQWQPTREPDSPDEPVEPIEPIEPVEPVESDQPSEVELDEVPTPKEPEAGYWIFRRAETAEAYPDAALSVVPVSASELEDRTVAFGAPSCYHVKSVLVVSETPASVDPEGVEPAEDLPGAAEDPVEAVAETAEPALEAPQEAPLEEGAPGESGVEETEAQEGEMEPSIVPVLLIPIVPPVANGYHVESEPSAEVCLTPLDTFAPVAPERLVAVGSNAAILLSWREVAASDLAGYRVYRSSSEEGPFVVLNEALVEAPSFSDATAEPGETYYYAVTAIDRAPEPNESAKSELASSRRSPND